MVDLMRKEAIERFERWPTPTLESAEEIAAAEAEAEEAARLPTVGEIEAIEQQAYDEGHKQGYQDGFNSGEQAVAAQAQRLDGLMRQLEAPFETLDSLVEDQLVELSCAIARQVIRRELKISPDEVVGAVREALAVLPVACRNVNVQLHPEDAALVREALQKTDGQSSWHISEDPLMTRGGCKIVSDTSHVDASIEKQMGAAIAAVLGDQRSRYETSSTQNDSATTSAPPASDRPAPAINEPPQAAAADNIETSDTETDDIEATASAESTPDFTPRPDESHSTTSANADVETEAYQTPETDASIDIDTNQQPGDEGDDE